MVLDPPSYAAMGGCGITFDDPDYVCKCGCRWSVTDQGRIHKAGEIDFDFELTLPGSGDIGRVSSDTESELDELNYDLDDPEPFGESARETLDSYSHDLLAGAGLSDWGAEWTERDTELSIRYLGREKYALEQDLADESTNTEQWLEPDE